MLPEIITTFKTMQYRLEEYRQLLDNIDTPCSEITEVWASFFEDFAVIGVNWQALWILSEKNCKTYDLLFPTAVIVNVNNFSWRTLKASVEVLAVQEDIVIPSKLEIPLIELHPIKVQNYDETDLRYIEDWIDKCRFFFKKLWYSWDAKLNVCIMDWCESHLKNRLKMHYDIKNGIFDKTITNYLKSLLAEAQNINTVSVNSFSQEEDERLIAVKKYLRGKVIKAELNLFEEPDLRYGMILLKKKKKNFKSSVMQIDMQEAKFVWMNGSCKSLIENLKIAQSLTDENIKIKVYGSLQEALHYSSSNDIVILPPGIHLMTSLEGMENGGLIKGLNQAESFIMPDSSTLARAILFECFGSVKLENLTISKSNGIAIQVCNGSVTISKCKIISKNKNSTSKGIVVISGCKLFLEECELQGFGTAVVLQAGTQASMLDSKIFDCYEGIKVKENSSLSLHQVEISFCSTFAIQIESSAVDSSIIGDLNLLRENNFKCEINANCLSFLENKKGNIQVKKSEKIFAIEEKIVNDLSDEVICINDEDNA